MNEHTNLQLTLAKDLHFLLETGNFILTQKTISFGRGNFFRRFPTHRCIMPLEAIVGPRDFSYVFNNIVLSLNFIDRVKKKRNDVTEIVLQLEIGDAIFRRERSDDRKCVCCSQATKRFTQSALAWFVGDWKISWFYISLNVNFFFLQRGIDLYILHHSQL